MKNVSHNFNEQYLPFKALLIYRSVPTENHDPLSGYEPKGEPQIYVESYDIGRNGNPINAHPLSVTEMVAMSELMQSTQELKGGYLKSRGVIPANVLAINPQSGGYAIWYTPAREANLFFTESLGIPCGKAKLPPLLWKATRESLCVYALKGKSKPSENTALYHAPFFNIYGDGKVCMGTVSIRIDRQTCLEDFIGQWESYFFNSYFSHTLFGAEHSKINIVQLWQEQVNTGRDFPQDVLTKNRLTLKNLIR